MAGSSQARQISAWEKATDVFAHFTPIERTCVKNRQSIFDQLFSLTRSWMPVDDNVVESSKQRIIQHTDIIGCCNYPTVRVVFLKKREKRIQNSANLTHVVSRRSIAADGVELVKQIDTTSFIHRVENCMQFGCCFSHELRDQSMKLNRKMR